MRKWLLFSLLIASPAGAFTNNQLTVVADQSNQIKIVSQKMNQLAQAAMILQTSGFSISGSTNTVAISAQQQADITALYASYKASLLAAYNALP